MFIYLILTLNLLKIVLSSETEFEILNENLIKRVGNEKQIIPKLDIFCILGQQISIKNALMSSYIHFPNGPKLMEVFSHQNHSKIVEHFKTRRGLQWTLVSKWLDTSLVTNIMIPTFRFHCIGIASKDSYELELRVQTVDFYRLVALFFGLLLFNLGPKMSRSSLFYFTSCATIGTFASFLIIFLFVGKYFPRKVSGLLIMLGSSAMVFAFKIFWESLRLFLIEHSFYVFIYGVLSALISISVGYRFGPITNHKTLNLIQWFLQSIGLVLIAISSQVIEYSCIAILLVILWRVIPIKQFLSFQIQRKQFSKIKLLTESEYELQSDVQTKKALEELKAFCLSSECKAWNIINKLKDPIRFARFINGENHISDNEIMVYENSESSHSFPQLNNNCNHFDDNNINDILSEINEDMTHHQFKDSLYLQLSN